MDVVALLRVRLAVKSFKRVLDNPMRKKVELFVVFLMFLPGFLFAEKINWVDWNDAVKYALYEQKPIMLEAMSNTCHYCKKIDRNVFQDSEMASFINKNFISVRINLNKEKMPLGIRVSMTPSFYFLTSKLERIKVVRGAWNKSDFKDILDLVLNETDFRNILRDKHEKGVE